MYKEIQCKPETLSDCDVKVGSQVVTNAPVGGDVDNGGRLSTCGVGGYMGNFCTLPSTLL